MKIKAVLFDLDGTLLPMDQEVFTKAYFGALSKKLAPYGYEPKPFIDAVWKGTVAMIKNDGAQTNEQVFWRTFAATLGDRVLGDKKYFDDFYNSEFNGLKAASGFNEKAGAVVKEFKARGYKIIVATNPVFPRTAQENRLKFAGVDLDGVDYITSYENSHFCKPNPEYYAEILRETGFCADECLMVGNDVDEDMVAEKLGLRVFLLSDCMINRNGKDISRYARGGFDELVAFMDKI